MAEDRKDTTQIRVPTKLKEQWEADRLRIAEQRGMKYYPMPQYLNEKFLWRKR